MAAAVTAVLVVGGILLGLNLQDTNHPSTQPATAPARGAHPSNGATRPSHGSSGDPGSTSSSVARGSGPVGNGTLGSTNPGPQKVPVMCTTVSGNLSGAITMSSCSQLAATGGSGTFPGSLLGKSGAGTVTWNGTGTTTFVYVSSQPASQRHKCPAGQLETTLRGSITANKPLGTGNVGVKGPVRAKFCIDSGSNVRLLAGRTFQL